MNSRIIVVSLLCLAPRLYADPDWAKVHQTTVRGIDHLFNLDFRLAEQDFDEVISLAPSDPRGYFFKSMVSYWIYNLTTDQKALDKFFDLSDKVIDVCESILESDQTNGMAKFYLGGIYGYRGLAHQRNGSLLSALWDGRKGYGLLEEAATQGEGVYDAQLGFGLFRYLVSRVPNSFRWILSIIGFSGDREGGLASIKLAADKGIYTRAEASFFYAQLAYFEKREEEASVYLQRLLDQYPGNTLFLITYATWEFRKNNLETAMTAARKAVEINTERNLEIGDEFAYNVLASFHFAQNEFDKAAAYTETAIRKTENKESIFNNTYHRLGLSYDLLGQREKAIAAYRMTKKADMHDNPWQYHHYRLARKRLVLAPDSADILHIRGSNAMALRQHERAGELFSAVLRVKGVSSDQRLHALYERAEAYFQAGMEEQALQSIDEALRIPASQEKWIPPHAYYRRGMIHMELGNGAQARKDFEHIREFDDYDFQDRLETQADEKIRELESVATSSR